MGGRWLDQGKLWRLCGEAGDLFYEALRVYQHSAASLRGQLAEAQQQQDWPELRRLLHRLKGSLPYLASEPLCQRLIAVTLAAQHEDDLRLDCHWPGLQLGLTALEQEIGQALSGQASTASSPH
ncbi:Hpt domain-containing protein [Pseudaeromonas paramecii]|uniref:Hpt domain-containing protein n=2 Tax=Pseudaeromonas paramecii TaxID=2138166 RepID=A0ABP8QFI4_9GAMM